MTTTKTFDGFNPNSRNSSKVLKPPGGGSSDIFGTNGGQGDSGTPARRMKNHNASNVFLNDGPAATTPARTHEVAELNGDNSSHSETDAAILVTNGNATAPQQNGNTLSTVQRNRVPPGGYSSGLW